MTSKPEWGWTPEVFVVFSTINGNPMFVFPIGRLPDIRFDEGCSFSEAFLRTYRKIFWDYLEQNDYKGGKFNIDLSFKQDLSNAQKERCYADTSETVQLLQENAYRVKEYLVKIYRANAETCNQLDDIANAEADLASVERPIHNESNYPSTWIYAQDKSVKKTQCNNDTAMASLGLQSSILTSVQDGFETTKKAIREVGETLGEKIAEVMRQAVKSAEQTPPPSPEQNSPIDGDKTSEETDDEWVLGAKWANEKATIDGIFSKSESTLIQDRLGNARERSSNTGRKYKGYDIFVDSKGREYYKEDYQGVWYKREQLEKDVEKLTRPKR